MTAKPTLSPEILAAITKVASTGHLLVAMDFDGVLSPLVDRADDARPLPESAAAMEALSRLDSTTTAMISGRALASLRAAASPAAATLLVGSHGAEAWLGEAAPPLTLDADQQAALNQVRTVLHDISALAPGTVLEEKPAGIVLHTRMAADDVAEDAVTAAKEVLHKVPGVYLQDGKRVLEVTVVRAHKGEGLAFLRQATDATAVVFAGDDVTDEDAFAVLVGEDVGIKVGYGFTQAEFRVESPTDVSVFLEALFEARAAHLKGA
ncbi:trehalose-phosphatase [Pseudarthrobacter sp. J1738]|uniref:trehalose-phosphatase n=1 Tax=Pseudarthrobacter sp. J1738 TaxID=3420446 RepID=UPI003D29E4C9